MNAKMWPARLPVQVRNDRYRAAEVRVYDLLQRSLGSGWTVFYSRPWLGLTATGGERDGECDFVVAHAKHGLLAIEVKGGGISYDPAAENWTSRDRDGIRHNIKNPVEQARTAKHQLLRRLKETGGWRSDRLIRIRHGVIFPDAPRPPANLGPDKPRELFCCRPDLGDIGGWISQRLSGGDEEGLGGDGIQALEKLLAAPFTLRVPLAHTLADDDAAIGLLTPQQFYVLDAFSQLARVAVGGAAGTGKTIVAVEDAVRLRAGGCQRTLLACLSEPLAADLRERVAGTGVIVETFASLCRSLASEAGLLPGGRVPVGNDGADLLVEAVSTRPDLRFDAIVVDEAQDFRSHWWIALEAALADPKSSRLHAFYDTNQSVYGPLTGQLAGFQMIPIHLSRNLRNTRAIHAAASAFYDGLPVIAEGPPGVSVDWIVSGRPVADEAIDVVDRLILHEQLNPADIAVLSASPEVCTALRTKLASRVAKGLCVSPIADFKGLERMAVVLAATPEIADERELAYVALTRARSHLAVVGGKEVLNWLGEPSAPGRERMLSSTAA